MRQLNVKDITTRMTTQSANYLETLARRLKYLADSTIGGQELFYKLEALKLDDPSFDLCTMAGCDSTGAILCHKCPLGPKPAGCMEIINPVLLKALKGKSNGAKLDLERISYLLTLAVKEFRDKSGHHPGESTEI